MRYKREKVNYRRNVLIVFNRNIYLGLLEKGYTLEKIEKSKNTEGKFVYIFDKNINDGIEKDFEILRKVIRKSMTF